MEAVVRAAGDLVADLAAEAWEAEGLAAGGPAAMAAIQATAAEAAGLAFCG